MTTSKLPIPRPVVFAIAVGVGAAGLRCAPIAPPPDNGGTDGQQPIYNNTTDPTNKSATYVGAEACRACHAPYNEQHRVHGHAHKLQRVQGEPPVFPEEGTRAGVPDPPEGFVWADITYIIGGYTKKARFIDQDGFILTTGLEGVNTQWNLSFPPTGTTSGFVAYEPNAEAPKPYDYSCFQCHTTGAKAQNEDFPEFQENRPGFIGTWEEAGVQCEACHGPGSHHIPNTAARDLFVGAGASNCGRCHTRGDDPNVIVAKDGFIQHHEQWPELLASGGHAGLNCTTCHDPHVSANYDRANAIRKECAACHADQNMALHEGKTYIRGDYSEPLTCESCHMPFATKSAASAGPDVVGNIGRTGDTRTHIFRIGASPSNYRGMFTGDGLAVVKDERGRAAVTLDFVCFRCHNGIGNAREISSLNIAADVASNMHSFVIPLTGKFVGAATCAQCHPTPHQEWQQTLHAKALETLEGIGQGGNADCLPCHTVGFENDGGFVDRATTNALAGVQCENCHGAGGEHARSPLNIKPIIDISADVCGACHRGSHHPNFEQWSDAHHSEVNETVTGDLLEGGPTVNNCGICHSGDVFYKVNILGETVPEDAFVGFAPQDLTPITCAICHDPHARTGNAAAPDEGRDFQLRFQQAASPTPSNAVEDVTNPRRFNLCGQCHHDRGRTWQSTSRPTHPSNQANVYAGEMAIPDPETQEPLVLSRVSVHSFAVEQCATCHMYREDFRSEEAPAISGHNFIVNNKGCASSLCHPTADAAIAAQATLQGEVQSRLDDILERLGDPATWEYVANRGPDEAGQAAIPEEIKQARFLYYYAREDGSFGVHNPAYVRSMLEKAEQLLETAGQ